MRKFLLTLIVAAVVPATIALAQTTTPPAEAPPPGAKAVPKPKAKAAPIVQSEELVQCSKQADAKGPARPGAAQVPRQLQEQAGQGEEDLTAEAPAAWRERAYFASAFSWRLTTRSSERADTHSGESSFRCERRQAVRAPLPRSTPAQNFCKSPAHAARILARACSRAGDRAGGAVVAGDDGADAGGDCCAV